MTSFGRTQFQNGSTMSSSLSTLAMVGYIMQCIFHCVHKSLPFSLSLSPLFTVESSLPGECTLAVYRVSQVANILRNLSFETSHAQFLSQHEAMLR